MSVITIDAKHIAPPTCNEWDLTSFLWYPVALFPHTGIACLTTLTMSLLLTYCWARGVTQDDMDWEAVFFVSQCMMESVLPWCPFFCLTAVNEKIDLCCKICVCSSVISHHVTNSFTSSNYNHCILHYPLLNLCTCQPSVENKMQAIPIFQQLWCINLKSVVLKGICDLGWQLAQHIVSLWQGCCTIWFNLH